jgi:hypothetical protein
MESNMTCETIPAHSNHKTIRFVLNISPILVIALFYLIEKISDPLIAERMRYLSETAPEAKVEFMRLIVFSIFGSMIVLHTIGAFFFLRRGYKALTHKQYPFPGMVVLKDTVVKHGDQARREGFKNILFGIILEATCFGLIFWIYNIYDMGNTLAV